MEARIEKIELQIAAKNELLLAARIDSETNPQDPIARAKVKHFEHEVARLEIAATNQHLLSARRNLNANPNNTDAEADVQHYEKELTRLQDNYNTLVAPAPAPTQGYKV